LHFEAHDIPTFWGLFIVRFIKLFFVVGYLFMFARAAAPSAFTPFVGQWQGELEYQDYQGPGRVKIPVVLEVKMINDTQAAWNFTYDDFGRDVLSLETHTWSGDTYTVETEGQSEVQVYQSSDFAALLESGSGQAILMGKEMDDDQEVEVRRTVTLDGDNLTTLKEIKASGGDYEFRNQSSYARAQ
jgi:hypothetical protein